MKRLIAAFLLMMGMVSISLAEKVSLGLGTYIFSIIETEETYEVMRLDIRTQENTSIYSFPKETSETFAELAPQDEIDIVYKLSDRVSGYLNAPMNVRPYRLAISPDQQQIAIAVEYNIMVTQRWERAGFTEVWIFDNQGHTKQSVLKIGLHSDEFMTYPTLSSVRDVYVRRIEWLPSQEGILISLTYYRIGIQTFDLIAVPLEENAIPFLIGNFNSYGISTDSRSLFGITGFTTLKTYSIDLSSGVVLAADHALGSHMIQTRYGLVATSTFIHFQAIDMNFSEVGDGGGGLAFLDHSEQLYSSDHQLILAFFPSKSLQVATPVEMKSYGDTLYIMSQDHSVWQLVWNGREPTFTPIIAGPVDFWELNGSGDILFHRTESSSWHILTSASSASGTENQPQIVDIHWPIDQQPVLHNDYQSNLIDW